MLRKRTYLKGLKVKERGFSLIEVLIALSILAVGLLAIASMQIRAIQVNGSAGSMTEGTAYAQGKMEELLALPYDDTTNANDPLDDTTAIGTVTTRSVASADLPAGISQINWTVDTDTPATGCKTIVVTVNWLGGQGLKRAILTCVKSDL